MTLNSVAAHHLRAPLRAISRGHSISGSPRLPALSQLRPSTHSNRQPGFSAHTFPIGHSIRRLHLGAVLESGVHLAKESLLAFHAITGLPWFLTIPLFALGVNLTVRLPLQVYSRKIILARSQLQPLLGTWTALHKARRPDRISRAAYTRKSHSRIFKERGLQVWKAWAPTLSIVPWLLMTDATRRMTGAGGGLISLFSGQYTEQQQPQQPQKSQGPAPDEGTSASQSDPSVSLTTTAADAQSQADISSFVEPTMAAGGALWFPDLTLPDPYVILPMVWAGTLCWALIPETPAARRAFFNLSHDLSAVKTISHTSTQWAMRLRRGALLVSIGMPMIAMNLPAGMLLYVVSSSLWAQLNSWILNRYMPFKSPWEPPPMALEKGWVKLRKQEK